MDRPETGCENRREINEEEARGDYPVKETEFKAECWGAA